MFPQNLSPQPASFQTSASALAWKIKLLYDGQCPLCLREVNFLQKRDAGRGLVNFVDIADLDYSPDKNGGVTFEEAMGRIHGVRPDGTIVRDVAVFREVYEALGMGWIYAVTRWPIAGTVANQLYKLWAGLRLRLTGRPSLEQVIAERDESLEAHRCRMVAGSLGPSCD